MDRIGRYKIVRELGRGAMGVVYHAIDPNIGRPVAIKTIQFASTRKPEELDRMRERLFREARSAGILSHPGIVTIYDVDQQGELAYIAMEYVDGPTLDQVLSGTPSLPSDRLFSVLGQTAAALDYAHSKGIVHRDIKPANIMVTADGTSKITDFGIAKITAAEQFTMTGNIVGTPHYMSPEQVQGHAVDGRSDQFSLAVIAYEMLTGEKPYTGEHLTTVVYKIVAEEPVSPRRLNPTLSSAIETVLRRALAKRPDARYRSCQEFADSLEKACAASQGWKLMARAGILNQPTVTESSPVRTRSKPAVTLPPPRHPARTEATATITAERRRSGFIPFLLAILVAAGLLALIGWQAAPWLMPARLDSTPQQQRPPERKAEAQSPPAPATETAQQPTSEPAATSNAPAPPLPLPPADSKPSPLGPPPVPREAARPDTGRVARSSHSPAILRDVTVISNPPGAAARIDGNAAMSCITPCTMQVAGGRHMVMISAPGYQLEQREVFVGNDPVEMAPVVLHATEGKLMLSSVPLGATVSLNGRRTDKVTPAELALAPGTYTVTVEKNGHQASDKVEIRDGVTEYRKLTLSQ
jgi:serine/threonine protein kinase